MTRNISNQIWVILSIGVTEQDRKGAGIIILVKFAYLSEEKPEYKTNCENLWVQINLTGARLVLIGAYYKPQEHDQLSFEEFNKSLAMVKQTNSQIWLLGDFNIPMVDWELMAPKPDCSHPTFYREFWRPSTIVYWNRW